MKTEFQYLLMKMEVSMIGIKTNNMSDDFMEGEIINASERFRPAKIIVPKVDELVSKIVGKTVLCRDPRLIKLIVSWKTNKPSNGMTQDDFAPDNFLDDPEKVKQLIDTFK